MLPDGYEDLEGARYGPVGRCIYCGARDRELTDEHIVPKGLDGTAVLEAASCDCCRRITGAVESDILRGPREEGTGEEKFAREMWHVRRREGMGSGEEPDELPEVEIVRDGEVEVEELPFDRYPVLLNLPILPPPAFFTGRDFDGAIDLAGGGVVGLSFGPSPKEVGEQLAADSIRLSANEDWVTLARMIAKIAYSFAVGKVGLEAFKKVFVADDILGDGGKIGRWVGGHPKRSRSPDPNLTHKLAVYEETERDVLLGEVRLFAYSPTPTYLVAIGSLV